MRDHDSCAKLHTRLLRIAADCPAVLPYFIEAVERLEDLQIDADDVSAILRVYRQSPSFVYLLLGMMDIVIGMENSIDNVGTS